MSDSGYQYIEASGVIVPDTADILLQVENEYKSALGQNLNTDPEGPAGVLINAEALARAEVVANNAALANQINPNIAGGICLDALLALTGVDVPPATNTFAPGINVTGVFPTTIPAGSQARTPAGDLFQTNESITLLPDGTGVVDFSAVEAGPVAAPVGAWDIVPGGVLGWETVNNPTTSDVILGTAQPSDAQLRELRNNTLAAQGSSLAEAIVSGLYNPAQTPGVRSLQYRENYTGSTAVIDGITLVKNSIWVCVQGGSDADIAATLLAFKTGGTNWNGAVTVNVTEPASGQVYLVKFDRPSAVPTKAKATVRLPSSVITSDDVVNALLAYAAGTLPNLPGFVVGGSVSPFEEAAALNSAIPGIYVQKMEVAKTGNAFGTVEVALALNEVATLSASDITVVVLP